MCIFSPSKSVYKKAPGTSMVAKSRFYFAAIEAIRSTDSVEIVDDEPSIFCMFLHCFLPSAKPRTLIVPSRFFFKIIR